MIQKPQIYEAVVKALTEIQKMSGNSISTLNERTRPIGDLAGFDSLNALEAIISISTNLGRDLAPEITLFADNGRARTIGGIVDCIHQQLNP